jgi:hypothetical protein
VKQFDYSREPYRPGRAIARTRVIRRKQKERGAQALPSPAQEIAADFRDRFERNGSLPREFLLDQSKVVADKIENLPNRKKWDGLPSWPA